MYENKNEDKDDLTIANLIKKGNEISESIACITENYKNIASKNDIDKFKKLILNSLNQFESNEYIATSSIRITCVDRVGSILDYRNLISEALDLNFEEGNFKIWSFYKNEVYISIYKDSIEFFKTTNKEDDFLLYEIKEKILNKLIKNFNTREIYLNTTLSNGYSKFDLFTCENYVEPEKSFFSKFLSLFM